jgi:hypothetical protein
MHSPMQSSVYINILAIESRNLSIPHSLRPFESNTKSAPEQEQPVETISDTPDAHHIDQTSGTGE